MMVTQRRFYEHARLLRELAERACRELEKDGADFYVVLGLFDLLHAGAELGRELSQQAIGIRTF